MRILKVKKRIFSGSRWRINYFCISFRVLLILSFFANPAFPRTWHIKSDGSGDAPTIQAGIDSASTGDSILVAAGSYFDTRQILIGGVFKKVNVFLYKNLKVLGEGGGSKTMIKGYFSDIAIYTDRVDSTGLLKDLIIETSWDGYTCTDTLAEIPVDASVGIECFNSSLTISDNLLRYNDVGVRLIDSETRIQNNEIHHCIVNVLCTDGSDANILDNEIYDGKRLIECKTSSPRIEGNDLRRACEGIRIKNGATPLIADNTIHFIFNWAVVDNSGSIIENNRLIENATGVLFEKNPGQPVPSILRSNLFYENVISVEIASSENVVIENNTIDAGEFGIYSEGGYDITVQNNIITRPTIGISCSPSDSLIIECNNIFDAIVARYSGDCPDLTGIDGNISLDPQFCGIYGSGNYTLQSDSPCAPGNHPDTTICGLIGAFDVNCSTVQIEETSFGAIKALFEKKP